MDRARTNYYDELYSTDLKHLEKNLAHFLKGKKQSSLSSRMKNKTK